MKPNMAPSIRMEKFAVNNYTSTPGPFPAPTPADSSGTITNVVFGLLALVIGVTTVWQAHRAYYLWNRQEIQRASNEGKTILPIFSIWLDLLD